MCQLECHALGKKTEPILYALIFFRIMKKEIFLFFLKHLIAFVFKNFSVGRSKFEMRQILGVPEKYQNVRPFSNG